MNYLVDANVLSEPTKPAPNPKALAWLLAHEAELAVDPIVLGEVSAGILALPRGRRRIQLEHWFDDLIGKIECVAWDAEVGLRWSSLVVDLRRKGRSLPIIDSLIAASALAHDLTLVTRDVRNFRVAGVRVMDPFR